MTKVCGTLSHTRPGDGLQTPCRLARPRRPALGAPTTLRAEQLRHRAHKTLPQLDPVLVRMFGGVLEFKSVCAVFLWGARAVMGCTVRGQRVGAFSPAYRARMGPRRSWRRLSICTGTVGGRRKWWPIRPRRRITSPFRPTRSFRPRSCGAGSPQCRISPKPRLDRRQGVQLAKARLIQV